MRNNLMACFVLLALAGCSNNHPIRFTSGQEEVGTGTVIWYALDDSVWVIIWFDIGWQDTEPTSYILSGKVGPMDHVEWRRGQTASDRRKFDMRIVTDNKGKTGEVSINGSQFRVESGRVFLVSTRGAHPGTVQIVVDLAGFQPTRANLDRLAESQRTIKDFVANLKEAE
jgi:hypothetical protein